MNEFASTWHDEHVPLESHLCAPAAVVCLFWVAIALGLHALDLTDISVVSQLARPYERAQEIPATFSVSCLFLALPQRLVGFHIEAMVTLLRDTLATVRTTSTIALSMWCECVKNIFYDHVKTTLT